MPENSSTAAVPHTKWKIKTGADLRWADNLKAIEQRAVNFEQNLGAFERLRSKHRTNNECFNDARKVKSSKKRSISVTNIETKGYRNIWAYKRFRTSNK